MLKEMSKVGAPAELVAAQLRPSFHGGWPDPKSVAGHMRAAEQGFDALLVWARDTDTVDAPVAATFEVNGQVWNGFVPGTVASATLDALQGAEFHITQGVKLGTLDVTMRYPDGYYRSQPNWYSMLIIESS